MPGQRKRRAEEQARRPIGEYRSVHEWHAAGTWEVLFETRDYREWADFVRRLQAENRHGPEHELRMDAFCGGSVHPTTYRLSRFVPPAPGAPGAGRD
ncbi:hypothetical protein [Kitasatospora sp. NPDC088134]|uniref:hypothetical protein n=1 Tax=Kitasatospora sp. NPDC088134 TaxID=3364071 RepID=UPI0037F8DA6D